MIELLQRQGVAKALGLCFFLILVACEKKGEEIELERQRPLPMAFWVWNRESPLTEIELAQLKRAGVETIYWQIAELEIRAERLSSKARWTLPPSTEGISFLPVIRLESSILDPAQIDPFDLVKWVKNAGVEDALQFDYDCPERLLSSYAKLLRSFRQQFGNLQLSSTALASWCESAKWSEVEAELDEVFPMFYDALPEVTQKTVRPDQARVLVDAVYVSSLIDQWSEMSKIPWQAGLPNFTRLSIFRKSQAKGHIRDWHLEELLVNPALRYQGRGQSEQSGISLFEVESDTSVGGISLQAGDWLCLRICDREALRQVLQPVDKSSATGVVWFQLARQGLASSGWSLGEIENRFSGKPDLQVSLQGDRLVLKNSGTADVEVDFSEGHELRLVWDRPILREFIAGDFIESEFLQNGRKVPAVGALQLKLGFLDLAAGQSLSSGLVLFRHDKKKLAVKYQIDDGEWKTLKMDQ